ncbi:uncharacterized protein [Oscarella lobularis]|uniref:uncharacterized protein n=1 Tax=Oscarella lobularis TaxID=121494 RepID=UPI0033131E93
MSLWAKSQSDQWEEPIQTVISEMQRVAPVMQQLTGIQNRLQKGAVAVEELMSRKRREFRDEMEAERKELTAEKAAAMGEIRKEREKLEEQKKAMEGVYKFQSSKIKLDIGGTKFTTSLETLCSEPGSMLEAMFSGRHKLIQDEDGYYFIDRDGTHFRYILNYLRDGIVKEGCLPSDPQIVKELEVEADFYQLQGLLKFLEGRGLPAVPQDDVDSCFRSKACTFYSQNGSLLQGSWVAKKQVTYKFKNLSGLDFSSRKFTYGASFVGSILRKANFRNSLLTNVDFTNADLRDADFENSNLSGRACFTGAKLDGARFSPGIKEQLGLH